MMILNGMNMGDLMFGGNSKNFKGEIAAVFSTTKNNYTR
jgi:hypothetical protein